MKLSTKVVYGIMALYRLSLSYGEGPVSLRLIAEEENLSKSYLEQLFFRFKEAGIIEARRGVSGGYVLTRKPEQVTLGEIMNALEGDIELSCCSKYTNCSKALCCPTRDILNEVTDEFEQVLHSYTLADMKAKG